MTTLIEKMMKAEQAGIKESMSVYSSGPTEEDCAAGMKAALAVVHAYYSERANVTDAMVEAAIMSWDTAETEGVLDDWKHAIAAAMMAAKEP